jgi:hypothetical protein
MDISSILMFLGFVLFFSAIKWLVDCFIDIIDPDRKFFPKEEKKKEKSAWGSDESNYSANSGSSSDYSSSDIRREIEQDRRDAAYNDYSSYIRYMDDDEAEDQLRIKGYSYSDIADAKGRYNSGFCYIATASLQGNIPYDDLLPLKQWRYEVMEKSKFGNKLSNYYRRTAPKLAKKVDQMPVLASFLRECFIRPSLVMVTKKRTFFRNALLYINFFFVLGLTTIFTKFKRF